MEPRSMTRKDFIVLTFTLVGGAAGAAACSSSSGGGTGGSGGGGGGSNGNACTNPLPETMEPDQTMHTHTVAVQSSLLNQTTDQTVTTSGVMNPIGTIAPHTHMVVFTVANLAILKAGGSVMVTSASADDPISHVHTFDVSCTSTTGQGGANGTGGVTGSAGAGGLTGGAGAGVGGAGGI
jgi:hypothetical protein